MYKRPRAWRSPFAPLSPTCPSRTLCLISTSSTLRLGILGTTVSSCALGAGHELSRPMLPRAIGRLPAAGIRSRPLSTHKTYYYWGSASAASQSDISVPRTSNINVHVGSRQQRTASCGTAPAAGFKEGRRRQWQDRRQFSTGRRALAPVPSPEIAEEELDQQAAGRGREDSLGIEIESSSDGESLARFPPTPPAAAGLRPETAPASTPLDLGCKAYYMARNIGIKTVCTVRHVWFQCSIPYSLMCWPRFCWPMKDMCCCFGGVRWVLGLLNAATVNAECHHLQRISICWLVLSTSAWLRCAN